MEAVETPAPRFEGDRVSYDRGCGITEVWENRRDGLEHKVYLTSKPAGAGPLVVEAELGGVLAAFCQEGRILLRRGPSTVLSYQGLFVRDATGRELPSSMLAKGDSLRVVIDDTNARYPIEVDPLLTNPAWTADPANLANAQFGVSVCGAGDVNGDGYDDVAVGAAYWTGEATNEGRAYVYHGGAAGLSAGGSPDWIDDPTDQANAQFGYAVASAGDVNGDGFADVVAGGAYWDGEALVEGRAYVYHGWPGSLYVGLGDSGNTGWFAVFREKGQNFSLRNWAQVPWQAYNSANGETRPACGDVDGDGFSEVVIGLGTYGTSGGWLAVHDDAGLSNPLLAWIRVPWATYNTANGETWPAARRP